LMVELGPALCFFLGLAFQLIREFWQTRDSSNTALSTRWNL
jgi:hypothetical protein